MKQPLIKLPSMPRGFGLFWNDFWRDGGGPFMTLIGFGIIYPIYEAYPFVAGMIVGALIAGLTSHYRKQAKELMELTRRL